MIAAKQISQHIIGQLMLFFNGLPLHEVQVIHAKLELGGVVLSQRASLPDEPGQEHSGGFTIRADSPAEYVRSVVESDLREQGIRIELLRRPGDIEVRPAPQVLWDGYEFYVESTPPKGYYENLKRRVKNHDEWNAQRVEELEAESRRIGRRKESDEPYDWDDMDPDDIDLER